ncbi:hypothetical protein KC678_02455 [Candidatus Dojkabacteria bacterium]|uniref:Uncharacterized protein n=1 Tax=Candidatus Dojkabacteria bacterium TaxID=2099670 RepID=A0A955IA49_9BACT|nr:hypothetical protein [Candidatus Dojkabacteria bacterium]
MENYFRNRKGEEEAAKKWIGKILSKEIANPNPEYALDGNKVFVFYNGKFYFNAQQVTLSDDDGIRLGQVKVILKLDVPAAMLLGIEDKESCTDGVNILVKTVNGTLYYNDARIAYDSEEIVEA